jgi:hypothetical protein
MNSIAVRLLACSCIGVRFGGSEECNMIIPGRKRCMIVFQTNR